MPPKADPERTLLKLLNARDERESAGSLSLYLDRVIIDCVPQPRIYREVRENWQKKRDEALVPAFEFVSGLRPDYSGPLNFYLGFSKGTDKTSSIGRFLNWMLAFGPRKGMRFYVGAKDVEQAGVLKDAMLKEAKLNPWLYKRLDFTKKFVKGTINESELHILANDPEGTQGKNPDAIICDEISAWPDKDFFTSLTSGVMKRGGKDGRQRCLQLILTNAGYIGSWQDQLRQMAKANAGTTWHFYDQPPGPSPASWISPAVVEQQAALISKAEADRLFYNKWTDLTSDRGAFRPSDVDACLGYPTPPPTAAEVFIGVDYGGVLDRTALAVLWFDGRILHVTEVQCWQGSPLNEIKIADIDSWLDKQLAIYPNATLVFDKYQMLATIQRLELKGVKVVRFEPKAGKSNYRLIENLRTLLTNHKMRFTVDCGQHPFDGTNLADELKSVIQVQMSYGMRLDHDSGKHDDRVIAVGMAALEAVTKTDPVLPSHDKPKKPTTLPALLRPVGGGFKNDHFADANLFGTGLGI